MQLKATALKPGRKGGSLSTLLAVTLVIAGCSAKPTAEDAGPEIRGTPIVQSVAKSPAAAGGAGPQTNIAPAQAAASQGYLSVGFDRLSGYAFEVNDDLLGPITNALAAANATEKTDAMIPQPVHALNNKQVAIKGFMLPLKVEGGVVTELLIMKDQSMCCYGSTPKINEWISVKMKGKGVKPLMDQPVTLFGTLHVGETRENGYLVGIYRLDGERMEAPEE